MMASFLGFEGGGQGMAGLAPLDPPVPRYLPNPYPKLTTPRIWPTTFGRGPSLGGKKYRLL